MPHLTIVLILGHKMGFCTFFGILYPLPMNTNWISRIENIGLEMFSLVVILHRSYNLIIGRDFMVKNLILQTRNGKSMTVN